MADLIQIGIDVKTNIKQATADLDKMGGSVLGNVQTFDRLESEVKQLNNALAKGRVTEVAYAKGMKQINGELLIFQKRAAKSAEVERKFGAAAASGGKSMNRFNVALQQGGFQLQDFAVQLQSGTSFFTAFGQQGSQFAGIFGPKGAVIGAVIAIGSAIGGIAVKSLMAGKEVKEFGDQVEDTTSVMSEYISLASEADNVFSDLFKSSKAALSQTSQASKDLLLIAKTDALDSIRGLGKSLADANTEAGFWAKAMANTDKTVTGNLLNIDTALRGNITVWKETGKQVQSFIDDVRNIGEADSIDGMYESALKARDAFQDTVDVTGEMTNKQKTFWKELSTTILNLEVMGATVDAMNGSWSETKEAIDAATASIKLFYDNAERDASAQDKRKKAVEGIATALEASLQADARRVELAQAGANIDEVKLKHAREDFILQKQSEGILGNNLVKAMESYDAAQATLKVESDRLASLREKGLAQRQLARDNAAYEKSSAIAAEKAKAEAQKLLDLTTKISASTPYEPMSAVAVEAAKSQAEMVKLFKTSADLKDEIGEAAFEALRLAGVDMASPIDAAALAAARLASDLNISLAAAIAMSKMASDEDLAMSQGVVSDKPITERFGVKDLLNMGYTKEYLTLIGKIKDESDKTTKSLNNQIKALEDQAKAMNLNANATKKYAAEYKKLEELRGHGLSEEAFAKEVAKLNEELANSSPVLQGFTDAFTDFLGRGANDFKAFANDILDMFKNMIVKMIAMAAKNKIMLSMGMGGGALGTAAQAGQLAGVGAPAGGGMMGSLIGGFGVAGGAAGTGILGGAAAAFSGFASGGMAGGFSAMGTALGGATTGMAGFGMALGAVAGPLLAVVAVISFFKKKVKELDSGLQGTVTTLDATIESFSKIQTSRFFGLSKKVSTSGKELSEEAAAPFVKAIQDIQMSVMDAASEFGIAGDVFDNFSYDFKLSLKGLSEEAQSAAIAEEFTKMGDSFAEMTGHFKTMAEAIEAANQKLTLRNRLDELLGNNAAILARQREAELKAMHELNRPLAQMIYNLEDAQAALAQADQVVAQAFAGLSASIEAEKNRLRDAFTYILDGLKERLDVANDAMARSSSIYSMLESAVSGRSVTSGIGQSFSRREGALGFIGGGDFSDERKLREALGVVAEPTEELFGSFVDYARDFARTSITLDEAKKVAQVQLTADEKSVLLLEEQITQAQTDLDAQLEALDKQYQMQVDQYNALLGIDTSVKSVEAAIANLGTAIQGLVSAQASAASAAAAASAAVVTSIVNNTSTSTATNEVAKAVEIVKAVKSDSDRNTSYNKADDITLSNNERGIGSGSSSSSSFSETVSQVKADISSGWDKVTSWLGFATGGMHQGGLRMVGERGPELEATGPSRIFSHNQTSSMFKDPDLVEEIRGLRSEVSGLRSEQRQMQASNVKYVKRNYDINRKWDTDGLPATRT